MSRKEKRKEVKKLKRKQLRQQQALQLQKEEEEALALDPSEVVRQQVLEEQALAKEKEEHEAQEKLWLLREEQARLETLRKQEEEAVRKLSEEEWKRRQPEEAEVLEDGWEYVEDGPAEIIWQGNEIIVNKPRRKVWRGDSSTSKVLEDKTRATSNPLPPQSTAFSTHQLSAATAVTDQSSNFGTEQDKRNCPFYLKTGVCRFGVRCSRMHPIFNEKACTLLMRSMYNGAGLAFDDLEGLEGTAPPYCRGGGRHLKWKTFKGSSNSNYTDEEVISEYEDFYDDVHPEFLQFGEIVNFKVCRNGSPHLRGNLYVHYLSDESAMAAYNSINGRFFAKKQITCEFVGVTKWRAAICGEYMKANYKPCSHGTACNFMHVFHNPRGEYDWADWDKAPPWHWQKKMARMFGRAQDSDDDNNRRRRRDEDWNEGAYEDDYEYSWRDTSLPDNHSHRSRYHSNRKSRTVDRHRRSRSRDRHQRSRHRRSRSQDGHGRSRSRDRHRRSRSQDGHRRSRSQDRHRRSRSQDRHRRSRSPDRNRRSRSPDRNRRSRSPDRNRRSRSLDRNRRSRSLEHHIPRSSSQERLYSSINEWEDRVKNGYEKDGSPSLAGSRSRRSRSHYGHGRSRSQSRHFAQRLNSREQYHSGSDEADDRVTTGYESDEGSRNPMGGDGKRHSGLGSHDSDNGETTRGYCYSIEGRGDYDKAGQRCHRHFSRDPKNSDNWKHRNRRKRVSNPEDECSPCSRSFADGRWKMNGDVILGERGAFALKESSPTDLKFERDPKVEDSFKDGEQRHVATTNGDGLERKEIGVSLALNVDAVQESTVRWLKWKHLKPKTTRQATSEARLE